jgi:uroporphyrinogen decarboxylase
MKGRERCIAALSIEEPDVLPIGEAWVNPPIVKEVTGYETMWIFKVTSGSEEITLDPYILCYKKLGFDYIVAPISKGVTQVKGENIWKNEWGTVIRYEPTTGATAYIDFPIKTMEDLKDYEPPDPFDSALLVQFEYFKKKIGNEMLIIAQIPDGGFPYSLMPFSDFLKSFYVNPSLAEKLCELEMKYSIELGKRIVDAGAEAVLLAHDFADKIGPFLHPKFLRRMVFPKIHKVVQTLKKRGVFVIKHCDGNIMMLIQDFINMGFDAIHPLEPKAGNDIGEVKEKYGDKLCLLGNVDCTYTLCFGSQEDVKKETIRCIHSASPGGGHILGSSHSLHHMVKLENVMVMIKTARKYGKYPLSR